MRREHTGCVVSLHWSSIPLCAVDVYILLQTSSQPHSFKSANIFFPAKKGVGLPPRIGTRGYRRDTLWRDILLARSNLARYYSGAIIWRDIALGDIVQRDIALMRLIVAGYSLARFSLDPCTPGHPEYNG